MACYKIAQIPDPADRWPGKGSRGPGFAYSREVGAWCSITPLPPPPLPFEGRGGKNRKGPDLALGTAVFALSRTGEMPGNHARFRLGSPAPHCAPSLAQHQLFLTWSEKMQQGSIASGSGFLCATSALSTAWRVPAMPCTGRGPSTVPWGPQSCAVPEWCQQEPRGR